MKNPVFLMLILIILSNCSNEEVDLKIVKSVSEEELATSISKFGFELFYNVFDCDDNVLVSPLSIHSDLTMLLNGAGTSTYTEMASTLKLTNADISATNTAYQSLYEGVKASNSTTQLNIYNAIFFDPARITLGLDFSKKLKNFYFNEEVPLNFSNNDASVSAMNQWAAEKTKGRLPFIKDEISSEETAILTNALYFIGDWKIACDSNNIQEIKFKNEDGSESITKMVPTKISESYLITEDYDAVDLAIVDGYSMTFVMPKKEKLTGFLKNINRENFHFWYYNLLTKLDKGDLNLLFPKFTMEAKLKLNKSLMNMGMNLPFTAPDFSQLSSTNFYQPGEINHQAFLSVTEGGIEGAAITTISIVTEMSGQNMTLDRPFFFVVRKVSNNLPIFIGKMSKMK